MESNGKILQVLGPVVDVQFNNNKELPFIKDALYVDNDGKTCVMEVAQHMGTMLQDASCFNQVTAYIKEWT